MAFNITNFKSTISAPKFNGLAPANRFIADISVPPRVVDRSATLTNQELAAFCDTANLPGKNIQTVDYKQQGYGDTHKMPLVRNVESLQLSFMVDSNYYIVEFFQQWLDFIIENNRNLTPDSVIAATQRGHREIAYREDYAAQVELKGFNKYNPTEVMTYTFVNAFPVQIGSVQMGWEQNDTIARLPVEFTFSNYYTKTTQTELNDRPEDTEVGAFERLAQIGNLASLILSTRRPRNIQDIINIIVNARVLTR